MTRSDESAGDDDDQTVKRARLTPVSAKLIGGLRDAAPASGPRPHRRRGPARLAAFSVAFPVRTLTSEIAKPIAKAFFTFTFGSSTVSFVIKRRLGSASNIKPRGRRHRAFTMSRITR